MTLLIANVLRLCGQAGYCSLIMLHYVGHGGMDVNRGLYFYASNSYPRKLFVGDLFTPFLKDPDEQLNQAGVIIILDSCFSGRAIRGAPDLGRSVEVIAVAANQQALGNHADRPLIQNNTFTARLSHAVAEHVGKNNATFAFENIIAELKRCPTSDRVPQHSLEIGKLPIEVPILRRSGSMQGGGLLDDAKPHSHLLQTSYISSTLSGDLPGIQVVFLSPFRCSTGIRQQQYQASQLAFQV